MIFCLTTHTQNGMHVVLGLCDGAQAKLNQKAKGQQDLCMCGNCLRSEELPAQDAYFNLL